METNIETKAVHYLELFDKVKAKVGDEQVALGIVQELGKDGRVERMRSGFSVSGTQAVSNGDQPATEKQIGLLRRLGADIPTNLTKRAASELIDATQAIAVR